MSANYSVIINNEYVVRGQQPHPPASSDRSNLIYEEEISETTCAESGNVVSVLNEVTGARYIGCLFQFPRQGGMKNSQWYSELLLVSALIGLTGEPCTEFEAIAVFTDHLNRVNVVRLVPKGHKLDDGDEDYDPDVTASPSCSQRLGQSQSLFSPRQRRMSAAFEEFQQKNPLKSTYGSAYPFPKMSPADAGASHPEFQMKGQY